MGSFSKCYSNLLYHWADLPIFRQELPYLEEILKTWCVQFSQKYSLVKHFMYF
jgi:hypothetical protein